MSLPGGQAIPSLCPPTAQYSSLNPARTSFVPKSSLTEAVENLAWDYLEERHAGWENNDGAFGTFVFDVAGRTITLEHNERFTDVTTSTHEF
jgi:hypothetical protein